MDVFQSEVQWSSRLEKYFCDLGEKALCLSYLHKKCESRFTKKSTYIDLPVIVLSTIAGTLSIGSSSLFQGNERLASVGVGSLSLVVGVLNTVNSYFAFNRRAENHKLCFIQFGKLHRFLEIEMALPREQRIKAKDLLKFTREQYERLQEIAPLIPKDIIAQFRKKYKKTNIAQPEIAQGPQPIKVFRNDINYIPGKKRESMTLFQQMNGNINDEPIQDESEPIQQLTDTPNSLSSDFDDFQPNAMNLSHQMKKLQSIHPPLPSKLGISVDSTTFKGASKFLPKELKEFKKKTEKKLKKFKKAVEEEAQDAVEKVKDVAEDVTDNASSMKEKMENKIVKESIEILKDADDAMYDSEDEGSTSDESGISKGLKKGSKTKIQDKMMVEDDGETSSDEE